MKKKKINIDAAKFIAKIESDKYKADMYRAKKSYYGLYINKTNAFLLTVIILTIINPSIAMTYLSLIYNDLLKYTIILLCVFIILVACCLVYFGRRLYNDLKNRLGDAIKSIEKNDTNNNTSGLDKHGISNFDTEA